MGFDKFKISSVFSGSSGSISNGMNASWFSGLQAILVIICIQGIVLLVKYYSYSKRRKQNKVDVHKKNATSSIQAFTTKTHDDKLWKKEIEQTLHEFSSRLDTINISNVSRITDFNDKVQRGLEQAETLLKKVDILSNSIESLNKSQLVQDFSPPDNSLFSLNNSVQSSSLISLRQELKASAIDLKFAVEEISSTEQSFSTTLRAMEGKSEQTTSSYKQVTKQYKKIIKPILPISLDFL